MQYGKYAPEFISSVRWANLESSQVWGISCLAELIYDLINRQLICRKYLKPVEIKYLPTVQWRHVSKCVYIILCTYLQLTVGIMCVQQGTVKVFRGFCTSGNTEYSHCGPESNLCIVCCVNSDLC